MMLQYVAASFHLQSVSTANINTVQYPKLHKQCEMPTNPAVVISKVLLLQSKIMLAFVHSHSSLYSEVSPGLPKYKYHVTHFTTIIVVVFPLLLLLLFLLLLCSTNFNMVLKK